ncbi:hypothetical protein CEE45_01085 [Candidatus Heimdallarchaeota archaeon B3_Heim]|nr:MAG: hypothetical protein CEE45_01085 [Candidatus Heimdallarchaeota archaeon B3_Heim]
MVKSEEVKQIQSDLDLVTKTAKVLATKLEKISQRLDEMMTSLQTTGGVTGSAVQKSVSKAAPKVQKSVKAAPAPRPEPQRPKKTIAFDSTGSKAGRYLDAFLTQLQELKRGREICDALSQLRDQVMQSAEVGFHPAFHEMGREANRLKNMGVISEEEREVIIEKVYDWKERIG